MDISYILNHLGEERESYFGAVAPPVIQSSNFAFKTVEDLRNSFSNERNVHLYTRGNNPTVEILRKKVAALAGAEDALIFSSGAAAVAAAIMSQVKSGDHIVCVKKPYSWTNKLLNNYLSRYNISVTMVDGNEVQNFVDASTEATTMWMLESPNTFTFELQDLKALSALAKARNIVTVIDNSYCTSIGQRCIEMGIDIEVHSATKYYGGHSDVVAGFLIGKRAMLDKIFATELLNIGAIISPHDASLLLRSIRTLPLRLEKIRHTTEAVVAFMKSHPQVERIMYPFDESFPQYDLAKEQMNWCGGLFSANIRAGSIEEMELFCNSLRAFLMAVSWGGHESLMIPACSFYPRNAFQSEIYSFNLVRFYIGLEDVNFLINDLKQAFKKIE